MDKKIKVLFVLGTMHNGGTEVFVMNCFRAVNKQKFDMDFMIVQGEEEYFKNEIEEAGSHIYHLSGLNDGKYEKCLKQIKNFFSHHKYDIIHIHSCSLRFLAVTTHASRMKKTGVVIGHAHSAGEPKGFWVDKMIRSLLKSYISHNIDYGMACSTDSAEGKYTNKFIHSNRYKMIPNAIDTSKYAYSVENSNRIRSQYGLNGKYVIGIVGRLDKWKNQSFLMEVIQIVNQTQEVFLMIIGDGDIREELDDKAKVLGVEDKVIFTGAVSEANEYYSAMDLFCLPSYVEGFPFVLVEAQANGLKCLISDKVSRETDISGTSEFLPIQNPNIWAEAVLRNYNSRISADAIQTVRKKYDIKYVVKVLERIYGEAVRRRSNVGIKV